MPLTLKTGLLLLISFQSLVFALILIVSKSPKRWSNAFLAGFLLVLGLQMSSILLEEVTPVFTDFMCVYGFFYGPLLYLYTLSLVYQDFQKQQKQLLHLFPSILVLLTSFFIPICHWIAPAIYLSLLGYTIACYLVVFKYRKVVKQTTSINLSIDLNWLMWAVTMFSGVLLADVFQQLLPPSAPVWLSSGVHLGVFVLILGLVNGMFFKGIRQPQIFMGIELNELSKVSYSENIQSEKEVLDSETEALIANLKRFMESEKPFLDPSLTLKQLAEKLNIPTRKLSQLINQKLGQNFVDFVNTYRIELAKERLANPKDEKETVLEVMYEAGFNSKSSFNTKFKEKIGLTPTQYRNQFNSR